MDLKTLLKFAIKISGLFLVVKTVTELVGYFPMYMSAAGDMRGYYFFSALFPVFIGLIMWLVPGKITNIIVRGKPLISDTNEFFPQLERAALMLMGFYFLYRGLSSIVYDYAYSTKMLELLETEYQKASKDYAQTFLSWFQLLLAAILIFGSNTIVRFVRRAWEFGKKWPAS